MLKKKNIKNLLMSAKTNQLQHLKDTAESFNKIASKSAVDILKSDRYIKRTMVKQVKVDKEMYTLKVELSKPEVGGLNILYTCTNTEGIAIVDFTKTYKKKSRASTVIKDFGKITDSISKL